MDGTPHRANDTTTGTDPRSNAQESLSPAALHAQAENAESPLIVFSELELRRADDLQISLTLTKEALIKGAELAQKKNVPFEKLIYTALDTIFDGGNHSRDSIFRKSSSTTMLIRAPEGKWNVCGTGQRTIIYQATSTAVVESITEALGGRSGEAKLTLDGTEFKLPFGIGAARGNQGSPRKGPAHIGDEGGMLFFEQSLNPAEEFLHLQKEAVAQGFRLKGNQVSPSARGTEQYKIWISRDALTTPAFNYEKTPIAGSKSVAFKPRTAGTTKPRYLLYKTPGPNGVGEVRHFAKLLIFSEKHAADKAQKALRRQQNTAEEAPASAPAAAGAQPARAAAPLRAAAPPGLPPGRATAAPSAPDRTGAAEAKTGQPPSSAEGWKIVFPGSHKTVKRSNQRANAAAKKSKTLENQETNAAGNRLRALSKPGEAPAASKALEAKRSGVAPDVSKALQAKRSNGGQPAPAPKPKPSQPARPAKAAASPVASQNSFDDLQTSEEPEGAAGDSDATAMAAAAPEDTLSGAAAATGAWEMGVAAGAWSVPPSSQRGMEDDTAVAYICASQSQDFNFEYGPNSERTTSKRRQPGSGDSSPESGPIKAPRSDAPPALDIQGMDEADRSAANQAREGTTVVPCSTTSQ